MQDLKPGDKIVVTTAHRGVFFGEFQSLIGTTIDLTRARNCLYWSRDVKGFLGLAVTGPSDGCRIGPAADRLQLFGVTSVTHCTAEAAEKWEAAPWS